ncbi:MAG: FAD-dependent oxidoreductase [Candidatus Omnitrophica bacterium]|nr:FAD-dependent oxidoreductase [Candidatus Omnitrophota bacterium]
MPRHVVVIGGGFAGLRAAVSLADAGCRVTVLESRVGLGGRARSFVDPATGEVVDNGQHLFLSGYRHTMEFLERLGTRQKIFFQDRLKVGFAQPGGRISELDCPAAPAPWHLLLGILRSSRLGLRDKLSLGRIWRDIQQSIPGTTFGNCQVPGTDAETVEQWLTRMGQGAGSRAGFWDPLTIAALNEDPRRVSAIGLRAVLRTLMAGPWAEARLGVPLVGLSDLYVPAAQRAIEEKGGEVHMNRPAAGLEAEGSRVSAVLLADGSRVTADAVVSAVPPAALLRILPRPLRENGPLAQNLARFSTSPIISVNLWLDRPLPPLLFVALIGTRFQWLFNKPAIFGGARINPGTENSRPSYVALILSAAHDFIGRPNDELVRLAREDLSACFPSMREASITRSQVVREREATVSLTVGMERLRPGPATPLENLFLAGDWTATGLPATIESAVASGQNCARALLDRVR